jgi:hypothetical protein
LKKHINKILLFIVLLLWGNVVYRGSKHLLIPNNANTIIGTESKAYRYVQNKRQDIKIYPLAHNPFQFEIKKEIKKPDSINKILKPIKKPKPIKIEAYVPSVSYFGYIKSTYKNKTMILIKVENQLYKAKQNEKIQGIQINKIFKDSIQIQIGKLKKIVKISGKYY